MSTQLFAVIREDSKYHYQNPPDLPFPVRIADQRDSYRVRGNGDQYCLRDVYLYVKAGDQFQQISGRGAP